jgi:hypothetical protein
MKTTNNFSHAVAILIGIAAASNLTAAPILYTIGPDLGTFAPNVFTQINPANQSVSPLFNLGNGTIGINGGVAYSAASNLFYTISNDNNGMSSLESLSLAGPTFTFLFSPGIGYDGGLTYSTADNMLYAIDNDFNGASTLFRMPAAAGGSASLVMPLGTGFTGGLAYDALDSMFYAISNNNLGVSTLNRINTAGAGSVTPLGVTLGSGFLGGLAFDQTANLFYAIGNNNNGGSTLYSIDLGANQTTPVFSLGSGYVNAGLADPAGPVASQTPEPGTVALMAMGILCLAAGRWRRGRSFRGAALIAAAVTLSTVSGFAQYSSPIHDVDNPARQPFQAPFVNFTLTSGAVIGHVVTTVPANKVLVVEYISGVCDQALGLSSIASVDASNNVTGSQYLAGFSNALTASFLRLYVRPNEKLELIIDNLGVNTNCRFSVTGYYVNLP